jgi:cyclopropane fatty-acyl-phospholipid synthase-like methyltransferase
MTTLDLLVDLHQSTERQGPGSKKDTLQALNCIPMEKDKKLKILDIGCGTGGQTITLADHTYSHITAVDIFPKFLESLEHKISVLNLKNKIQTLQCSMDNLPQFEDNFDIIWSEGAIYNMGFEKGIKLWKNHLKPGGSLAVSEITWITQNRPKKIEEFWKKEYTETDTAAKKIKILEDNGYSLSGYFVLSQESWTENYYKPLEKEFPAFLKRHNQSPEAIKVVNDYRKEIKLYDVFKKYYSYGFYIAQKQ